MACRFDLINKTWFTQKLHRGVSAEQTSWGLLNKHTGLPRMPALIGPIGIPTDHSNWGMALSTILNDPAILFVDTYLPKFQSGSPEYKLLTVFAYGTWADYRDLEKSLPSALKLDPSGAAALKLKKLTLLTIFARQQNSFKFDTLLSEVGLSNSVDLESLVIDLLSADFLDAKIDEQEQSIIVSRSASRCVRNEKAEISAIAEKIGGIRARIRDALQIASTPQ
jgi:hypothetical protein